MMALTVTLLAAVIKLLFFTHAVIKHSHSCDYNDGWVFGRCKWVILIFGEVMGGSSFRDVLFGWLWVV